MGEEFNKAVAQALIRQEKRIAMLENIISHLFHYLSTEKGVLSEQEIDHLFDTAERLTELTSRDRLEQVREAFGLPLSH